MRTVDGKPKTLLNQLPPEARTAIWNKLDPQHITQILEIEEHDRDRNFKFRCLLVGTLLVLVVALLSLKFQGIYPSIIDSAITAGLTATYYRSKKGGGTSR